ncbi:MAG: histidinol-phosphatase HisJ family protein [Proteobacteria bacterium]|nr:histidinol-phosphatase HisJ family protein [Pseudomonadota bacterium]
MTALIPTDYHMHSTFSPDADHTPAQMCRQALALGFRAIAITDHIEWHANGHSYFPDVDAVDAYFETIASCQQHFAPLGLAVYSGVELGNPQNYLAEARAFANQHPFDVVIGSMHWLGSENIHAASCFEGRDATSVYIEYFIEMERMATSCDLDFVAHFDRIFWPGTTLAGQPDLKRLEPVLRKTLATIASREQGLELNTRFLDHVPNWNDTLITLLTWFRQQGGRHVLVNSDAHRIGELGRNQGIAQQLLHEAGFERPARLRDLKAIPVTMSISSEFADF